MAILIVDDNGKNRRLCRAILEHRGYAVREAANGEEGLLSIGKELPELILMDVQMPVLDGFQALERLKAEPATRGIPVVALTSHAMKGDRERFLEAGFAGYVSKPIDIDQLLDVVRNLTGGRTVS
jgi:two-component system cell cycle response regulator DivK